MRGARRACSRRCARSTISRRAGCRMQAGAQLRADTGRAFFFQAEDGIRDLTVWSSDVCSSDLPFSAFHRYRCRRYHLSACTTPEKAKAQHIARGEALLKDKKFQEAAFEFRSALQIDEKLADEIGRASCRERV